MEYKSVTHWFKNRRSRSKTTTGGNTSAGDTSDGVSDTSTSSASAELAQLTETLLCN